MEGRSPRSARSRRLVRWLGPIAGLVVVLLLLAWFAPPIVARSPLLGRLLNAALEPEQGRLNVRRAKLGWLSPVELSGLEVRAVGGELLLESKTLSSEKTLLALALDRASLGSFVLDQPKLYAKLRAEGSNLEDFIEPWLKGETSAAPQPLAMELKITGGEVVLVDESAARQWNLRDVAGRFSMPPDPAAPLELTASAVVAEATSGHPVALELKLPGAEDSGQWAAGSGQRGAAWASLRTTGLPLEVVQPLAARFAPGIALAGSLTSHVTCEWNHGGQPNKLRVEGEAAVDDFDLGHPLLGSDRLRLNRLEAPCKLHLEGDKLTIARLAVQCDVGQLEAEGSLRMVEATGRELLATLARESYRARGQLDLAQLAALLPETLHVRQGTQLTSGRITLDLDSSPQGEKLHRWTGRLETSELAAVSGGQKIVWEQPLEIDLAARSDEDGLFIERLACQSDFLQIHGSGTPEQLEATARYDLKRLAEQLDQFVDLEEWSLAGSGEATLKGGRSGDGEFKAEAALLVRDFELGRPGQAALSEKQLSVRVEAAGLFEDRLRQLSSGTVNIAAGDADRLQAELLQPVRDFDSASGWPVRLELAGSAARWLQRMRPWFVLEDAVVDADARVAATGTVSGHLVELSELTFAGKDLKLHGWGLNLAEDSFNGHCAALRADLATGQWKLKKAALATASLTLTSDELFVQLPTETGADTPASISGPLAVEGDLARLQRWFEDAADPYAYALAGRIAGPVQLTIQQGKTHAQIDLAGSDVQVFERMADQRGVRQTRPLWSEASVKLTGTLVDDRQSDRLVLQQARLESPTLGLTANGHIDQLLTSQQLALNGTIDYDLAQLTPLLEPYLGRGVALVGRKQGTFSISGPLAGETAAGRPAPPWSRRLAAEMAARWDSAMVHGLRLGPGLLQVRLAHGMLTAAPLDVAVEEGKVRAAPAVRLDPPPYELLLPKGPLLDEVRLSPELCDKALKYIAPVLADATRTDGRISVDLDGARIPLAAPGQGDLAGRLVVHRVEVLPGPLARDIILLSRQVEAVAKKRTPPLSLDPAQRPLVTIEPQQVAFRMVQGRVYHQGLRLKVGDVLIETQGSVGLDQSLALTASIPLAEAWIGSDPLLAGLKGQTVQVGIGGTLSQPKIDPRSVQNLAAQIARSAAQQKLAEEIDKGLNRLFSPKR